MVGGPKKNSPTFGLPHYTTFDDYWLEQDELWEISLKESKKQKDERLKKINDKNLSDMQKRISDNSIGIFLSERLPSMIISSVSFDLDNEL